MFDTMTTITQEKRIAEHHQAPFRNEQHILVQNIEEIVAAAQPRLARLARMQGVAPDGVEDVVQETFVEAWRHLEHLREPERFDAWLNGICRNVCLRWARSRDTAAHRQASFSTLGFGTFAGTEASEQMDEMPDPLALDPAEELSRQDLVTLLDRALSYLPASTREALTMRYLAEMPHAEVALRLGVTINALEVRLHRARRQLRQVLNNELRIDAEAFGLTLDAEQETGWRETSLWCFICGRQRLLGTFEPLPSGNVNMRLRCPVCSAHGCDITQTGDLIPLDLRSFRPAFKRVIQALPHFYTQAFTTGYQSCPMCRQQATFQGIELQMLPPPFLQRYCIVLQCPQCGTLTATAISACLFDAQVQQFILRHPRTIIEPEALVEYSGQPAIRARLIDIMSASRLTLFIHPQSLQVLNTFLE